jgi:hypothetical protein
VSGFAPRIVLPAERGFNSGSNVEPDGGPETLQGLVQIVIIFREKTGK